MARTVRVRLELDRADYRQGLRDAANDTRGFDGEVRSANKDLGAMGVEVKSTGTEVQSMGRELDAAAKKTTTLGQETRKTKTETTGLGEETEKTRTKVVDLARDIDKAKDSLKAMGEEFRKTGQIDTSKFSEVSRTLRDLERTKAELDKLTPSSNNSSLFGRLFGYGGPVASLGAEGSQAGVQFGGGFLSSAGSVIAAGGPVLWAALVPVVAGLAGSIGAIIAGSALGGAGLGVIAAGLISQFSDPRVKGAVLDLGAYAKGQLSEVTSSFVGPFTSGIAGMKREMAPLWSDLQNGFHSLEPYIANLLVRLGEGLAKLGPGLSRGLEAAGPVLGALAKNIPTLLNGFNIFFDELAKGGKGAAEGIDFILKAVSGVVAGLGFAIRFLSDAFDVVVQVYDKYTGILAKIPGIGGAWSGLHDFIHGISTSFDESKLSADGATGSLDAFTAAAGDASGAAGGLTGSVQGMNSSMSTSIATMTGLDGAAISMKQSVQGLKDAIAQNGKSLDINTAAGQANIQAMLAGVQSAEALRKAQIDSGLSAAYADDQYRKNVDSLRQVMINAGMNRDAVDRMIGKYLQVPGQITTNVALVGAVDAISKGATLRDLLNSLDGKVSRAAVITTYLSEKDAATGGSAGPRKGVVTYNAMGGVYEHAAVGVLREANLYSAASPARYAYAEPSTGGEAFVPKYGDYGRSMSILNHAASWYGARVMPGGGGGGGANVINLNVNAGMGTDGYRLGQQIAEALRPFVQRNGNNVQMAIVGRQ